MWSWTVSASAVLALTGCGSTTIVVVSRTPTPTARPAVVTATPAPASTPQTITTLCAGQWSAQGLQAPFPVEVSISGVEQSCTSLMPSSVTQFSGTPNALAPISGAEWQTGAWVVACTTAVPGAALAVWVPVSNPEYVSGGKDICAEQLQPIESKSCAGAGGAPLFDAGGAAQCNEGLAPCVANPKAPVCTTPVTCQLYWQFNTDGSLNTSVEFTGDGKEVFPGDRASTLAQAGCPPKAP